MKNEFADTCKALSDAQLLDMVNNPGSYPPAAIEAAQAEIRQRSGDTTTPAQLSRDQQELVDQALYKATASFTGKFQDEVNTQSKQLVKKMKGMIQAQKSMRVITLLLALTCIQHLIYFFETPTQLQLLIIPAVRIPMVILLWLWKKTGWISFAAGLAIGLTSQIVSIVTVFGRISPLDPGIMTLVLFFLVYLALLIYICLPAVRAIYGISKKWIAYSILIGVAIEGAFMAFVFYSLGAFF